MCVQSIVHPVNYDWFIAVQMLNASLTIHSLKQYRRHRMRLRLVPREWSRFVLRAIKKTLIWLKAVDRQMMSEMRHNFQIQRSLPFSHRRLIIIIMNRKCLCRFHHRKLQIPHRCRFHRTCSNNINSNSSSNNIR